MSEVELLAFRMTPSRALEGATDESQALVPNWSRSNLMWQTRLPGSVRTIGSIAVHVASCKVMYANYASRTDG
jgi:hypothetical protein